MKTISKSKARSRKMMLRIFLRWFLYAMVLLVFFALEGNPPIRDYCPLVIIPIATAVAMQEGDLASGIFGAVCGLLLDAASGVTVMGFSALWLLAACPIISLLSSFYIQRSFMSHFILNAAVTVVMGAMDMLFLHWVWEGSASVISFWESVFPAYSGSLLFSIPIYFLIRFISVSCRPKEERRLEESANSSEGTDEERE